MFCHAVALLLIGKSAHGGTEEEQAQHSEQDKHFQENQPPKRPSPSHVPEAVTIEFPNPTQHSGSSFRTFVTIRSDNHDEHVDAENQADAVANPHGRAARVVFFSQDDTGQEPKEDSGGDSNLHPDRQAFGFAFFVNFPRLGHLANSHACASDSGGDECESS